MPRKPKPTVLLSRPPNVPPDWIDPLASFRSDAERRFAQLWVATYPDLDLHYEWPFAHPRRFTIDFCHVLTLTGIEIQGGIWVPGMGHSSGRGTSRDYEKLRIAAGLDWVILPIEADKVEDGATLDRIAETIFSRQSKLAS